MIYNWIGRLTVKVAKNYALLRYGRPLRVGVAAAVVAVGIGVFLASRNVEEG